MSNISSVTIYHDVQNQRFVTTINSSVAYLSYQNVTEHILDFQHTVVPSELGGKGIGSKLVKHALDYAQAHQKKVIVSCTFVASFMDKHDHYKALLA